MLLSRELDIPFAVTCHGLDLMGVADVPAIAGRSPSYIVRQMWDIQQGTRNADAVQLMKLAIARLTPDDLAAVAAYVASRPAVHFVRFGRRTVMS